MSDDGRLGETLGRYRLESVIGRGGFATVYRAHDTVLDRTVALKVLDAAALRDPNNSRRFLREGRAVANLDHPAVVPVYDAGDDNNTPWMAMRLVEGGALDQFLASGRRFRPEETLALVRRIASALDHAHDQELVHRDIKPSNILLDGGSAHAAWLTDFGIAVTARSMGLYTTGALGTAAYMAPEQARPNQVGPAADRYSLACVAYELLTGHRPFPGDDYVALLMAHANDPVPTTGVEQIDAFMARAMAKKVEDRPSSGRELIDELERALDSATGLVAPSAARPGVGGVAAAAPPDGNPAGPAPAAPPPPPQPPPPPVPADQAATVVSPDASVPDVAAGAEPGAEAPAAESADGSAAAVTAAPPGASPATAVPDHGSDLAPPAAAAADDRDAATTSGEDVGTGPPPPAEAVTVADSSDRTLVRPDAPLPYSAGDAPGAAGSAGAAPPGAPAGSGTYEAARRSTRRTLALALGLLVLAVVVLGGIWIMRPGDDNGSFTTISDPNGGIRFEAPTTWETVGADTEGQVELHSDNTMMVAFLHWRPTSSGGGATDLLATTEDVCADPAAVEEISPGGGASTMARCDSSQSEGGTVIGAMTPHGAFWIFRFTDAVPESDQEHILDSLEFFDPTASTPPEDSSS